MPSPMPQNGPYSSTTPLLAESATSGGSFGIHPLELGKLINTKNPRQLMELGGVLRICKLLQVDPTTGLSLDEQSGNGGEPYGDRRRVFGKNIIPAARTESYLKFLLEAYSDGILIMLTIVAVVSFAMGLLEDFSPRHPVDEPRIGWVEGTAIFGSVVAIIFTNATTEYGKEKQFQKLNAKKEDVMVNVLRGGKVNRINVFDLNVGDILLIQPGDIIAGDAIYIEGDNLVCDESFATGNSGTLRKAEAPGDCFLRSGSKVLEGVARVVVIAIGGNSLSCKALMSIPGTTVEATPLELKLDILVEAIAKLGITAALTISIVFIFKYFVNATLGPEFPSSMEIAMAMVAIVIQAIIIITVAVPGSLRTAVTLTVAFTTAQMLRDNNLVRVISACETMGNATAVCLNMNGTLTQNKMTVVEGYIAQKTFDNIDKTKDWHQQVQPDVATLIVESIVVNSNAFEGRDDNGRIAFVGSKTECALLGFSKSLGYDYAYIRNSAKIVKVYPFASQRKTMSVVTKNHDDVAKSKGQKDYRVFVKGASEIVLHACTHYLDDQGIVHTLDNNERNHFHIINTRFAEKGLRTITLAYRDVSISDFNKFTNHEPPNHRLVCLGIIGIQNPLRPGVVEAVADFRRAGIFVRMITGDSLTTACSVARYAGILTPGGIALTGSEFSAMSPEEQAKVLCRLQVLARSSPTDKTIVVTRLQQTGEIVAVTGYNTGDGPALKLADVGFSMGVDGTEVAKEASDIILMNDSSISILKALRWGRNVIDGVRKFVTFQLTVNIVAVVLLFITAVISNDSGSILSAVQLLWVYLIMDTLAALALTTEPPTDKLLERGPDRAHLINSRMTKMIVGQAIFQIATILFLVHLGGAIFHLDNEAHGKAVLKTIIFNTFIFFQIFNEINCRRIDDSLNVFHNIFRDWIFIGVQIVVIIGQVIIVNYGGHAFSTTPLTTSQWIVTIVIGSLSLLVGLIIRLLPNCFEHMGFLKDKPKQSIFNEQMPSGLEIDDRLSDLRVFSKLYNPKRTLSARKPGDSIGRRGIFSLSMTNRNYNQSHYGSTIYS